MSINREQFRAIMFFVRMGMKHLDRQGPAAAVGSRELAEAAADGLWQIKPKEFTADDLKRMLQG